MVLALKLTDPGMNKGDDVGFEVDRNELYEI